MIQDIAQQEAERYLIDNSAMLHSKLHTSPARVIANAILHGFTFCLNTLAGSDDADLFERLRDEKHSPLQQEDSEYCHGFNNGIEHSIVIIQQHTASAVAKAVGEKWVSTSDKLPKNGEHVLWLGNHGRIVHNSFELGCDQDDKWAMKNFTHWMPLPELPTPQSK